MRLNDIPYAVTKRERNIAWDGIWYLLDAHRLLGLWHTEEECVAYYNLLRVLIDVVLEYEMRIWFPRDRFCMRLPCSYYFKDISANGVCHFLLTNKIYIV